MLEELLIHLLFSKLSFMTSRSGEGMVVACVSFNFVWLCSEVDLEAVVLCLSDLRLVEATAS